MITSNTKSLRETRPHEYLARFVFGGIACVLAGLVAKFGGAAMGGLFLAFPAIFPCSATLIESHEKKRKAAAGEHGAQTGRGEAGTDALGAALGCVGLAAFAVIASHFLPHLPTVAALAAATGAWAALNFVLWVLFFYRRL